jgi:putative ABC transport system ATP-binding protein
MTKEEEELPRPKDVAKVEGVSKVYLSKGNNVVALRDVSFTVSRGEFLCLVGPSGSGKTTLLNLIGGLDGISKGKIFIEGIEISELSQAELSRLRHGLMGYIFQTYNLISVLTAVENVELPLIFDAVDDKELRGRATKLLDRVGLLPRLTHKPSELSGGEQQRVAIARALISNPSVVLADEPTANLDGKTGQEVLELMKNLSRERNVTFIVSTHDTRVLKYADRILRLTDGRLVGEETPSESQSGP